MEYLLQIIMFFLCNNKFTSKIFVKINLLYNLKNLFYYEKNNVYFCGYISLWFIR